MAKDLYIPVTLRGNRLEAKASLGQTVIVTEGPETYTGPMTVTPTESEQTLLTANKFLTDNVTVNPIPSEYVIPTGTEEISVVENGIITRDISTKAWLNLAVNVPMPGYKVVTGSFVADGQNDVSFPAPFLPDVFVMYSPTKLDGYTPLNGAIWYLAMSALACVVARKTSAGNLMSASVWDLPRSNNRPGLVYEDGILTFRYPGSAAYAIAENETYNYIFIKLS